MSRGKPGDGESRLARWSRLKLKPEAAAAEDAEPAAGDASGPGARSPAEGVPPAPDESDDGERELTPEEQEAVKDLPPVEELNSDSDFTAFLDKRVPEFIRRKALRKLWLSDPAFSFLDGMNEYDEDYSIVAELAAEASSYRPDQGGYAWRDKPETKEPDDETPGDAEAAEGAPEGARAAEKRPDADAAEPARKDGDSLEERTRRLQDRGGSSVRAPTYTANPYYQAPGMRAPVPDRLPDPASGPDEAQEADGPRRLGPQPSEDDDLGDGEDDLD